MAEKRERIVTRLIEDEMRESFIDYSMSVIVQRALPDVRDGLKPVHRRILHAMNGLGLNPDRPHKKSATVVHIIARSTKRGVMVCLCRARACPPAGSWVGQSNAGRQRPQPRAP